MSIHHDLDVQPIPKEKAPMYINEPWLIDAMLFGGKERISTPDTEADNIRVYAPLDLNGDIILRRLHHIISLFGDATEKNEMDYGIAVNQLISQIEIYDQIWYARNPVSVGIGLKQHSEKAVKLAEQFVDVLQKMPVADSEFFPYDIIEELKKDYLS